MRHCQLIGASWRAFMVGCARDRLARPYPPPAPARPCIQYGFPTKKVKIILDREYVWRHSGVRHGEKPSKSELYGRSERLKVMSDTGAEAKRECAGCEWWYAPEQARAMFVGTNGMNWQWIGKPPECRRYPQVVEKMGGEWCGEYAARDAGQ